MLTQTIYLKKRKERESKRDRDTERERHIETSVVFTGINLTQKHLLDVASHCRTITEA